MKVTTVKDFTKCLFLLGFLLSFSTLQASQTIPTPSVKIKTVNETRFNLYLTTLLNDVELEITDSSKKIIYKETLKKGYAYKKTFDITNLPNEAYYVKIKGVTYVKEFSVSKEQINLLRDSQKDI